MEIAVYRERAVRARPQSYLGLQLLFVCAVYYAGAVLGNLLRFPGSNLPLIWPPTPILLAVLLITPKRSWWAYLLAIAPGHIAVQLQDGMPALGAIGQLAANYGQALLAAMVVDQFNEHRPIQFDSLREMIVLTLGAGVLCPLFFSTFSAYFYVHAGWERDYVYALRAQFLSNVLSTITIAPAILLGVEHVRRSRSLDRRRLLETALLAAGLVTMGIVELRNGLSPPTFLYAALPLLLWAAVRLGVGGLSAALVTAVYVALINSSAGGDPLSAGSLADGVLLMELFLIAISLPLLFLVAIIEERRQKEAALRDSEARYRALVMASADTVWCANREGKDFSVSSDRENPNADEPREFSWLDAVHPEDRERSSRLWEEAVTTKQAYEGEMRLRTRNGSYRRFQVHAVPILTPAGDVLEWVGANTDITERKRAESRLKIQYAVTRTLSESGSMAEAVAQLLQIICECLDSEFGEMWQVNRESNRLFRVEHWHISSESLAEFAASGSDSTYAPGLGVPGRVWQSRTPVWISDIRSDPNLPRAAAAARAGLRSALGFPILVANETLGVMVFFSKQFRAPDDDLLQTMASIGGQVGQFAERKLAEQALSQSEARLKLTIESARIGYWELEPATGAFRWSETLERIFGLEPGSFKGSHEGFLALVHPEDRDKPLLQLERCLETRETQDSEYRIIHPDGTIRWIVSRGQAFAGADGGPIRVLGLATDITERKQAEEGLRKSEEYLRLALEAGAMGVWDWNPEAGTSQWSKEHYTLLGLAPFSVEPGYEAWSERVHPDDLPRARAKLESGVEQRAEFQDEYRIVWPNGVLRWVESRAKPIFDEHGRCVKVVGLLIDITERKRTEERLKIALEEVQQLKDRTEAENTYLREEVSRVHRFGEIIGRSDAMLRVLKQAERVAPTNTSVLMLGETGTGKELLARAVHARSKRNDRPLVKVNCASLPPSLIDSELFGHERGAFTGAAGKRVGRFELADGATIFLDEIGELPLESQAKLLRVLQEGEFERLGSSKTIRVDVRVIAATNRDLRRAIQEHKFREDLYYRLNVYPIYLPPLRERKDDIAALALEFLAEAAQRLGRSFEPLSRSIIEQLQSYDWPGNVRELQNVIERAALVSPGRFFRLPERWTPNWDEEGASESSRLSPDAGAQLTLEELERNHIVRTLQQTRWRIEGPQGAAAILGLNPSTLRSRMNKLGIRRLENQVPRDATAKTRPAPH